MSETSNSIKGRKGFYIKHKLVFIIILISIITFLSSCVTYSTTNPGPQYTSTPVSSAPNPNLSNATSTPSQKSTVTSLNATTVLASVIAAMSKVTSVNIASNIIDQYTFMIQQSFSETIHSVEIWDSQRSVDINNNRMHLMLNIDNYGKGFSSGTRTNAYYDKDKLYLQTWTFAQLGLSPHWGWSQSKLLEGILPAKAQLSPIIELLESANQTIFRSSVKLDGLNYQIISISPSAEAVADLLLSQEYQGGPQLEISTGIAIVGKAGFMKSFKSGTFCLWVDSDTNLVMKAYFSPVFQATFNELDSRSVQAGNIENDFIAQLNFSGYNQPVNIQIPTEALNATQRGN
jgi:hypothetical protein